MSGPDGTLTAVTFAGGGERECGGLLVPVTLHQRSALAEQLGAGAAEPGPLAADAVAVDASFVTSAPGLFAAGDLGAQMPSVPNAVASGTAAAAMLVGSCAAIPPRSPPAG